MACITDRKLLLGGLLGLAVLVAGCATTGSVTVEPPDDEAEAAEAESGSGEPKKTGPELTQEALRDAYEQGVRDAIRDFKAKSSAPHYVYEPPVIEYVEVPAQVRDGAFYPAHREPVVVRPGYWRIERYCFDGQRGADGCDADHMKEDGKGRDHGKHQ